MHAVILLTAYNFHHLLERNNQWVYINTKQTSLFGRSESRPQSSYSNEPA